MTDPKIALASIGKSHRQRIGPPPMIKAIQQDLIKVNFDPYKASAQLIRLAPKTKTSSSQLAFTPTTSNVDIGVLEAETSEDMNSLKSPSRNLSLVKPFSSSPASLVASRRSSLAIAASRKSSFSLSTSKKSSLGLVTTRKSSWRLLPSQKKGSALVVKPEFPPHGFRYHSNGDERMSRSSSSTGAASVSSCLPCATQRAEEAVVSFSQLVRLRARVMRQLPRPRGHPSTSRLIARMHDMYGGTSAEVEEKHRLEEEATPGLVRSRAGARSTPSTSAQQRRSSALAVAREGDNMFKQTILRHLRDMAAQSSDAPGRSLALASSAPNNAVSPVGGGGASRISLTHAGSSSSSCGVTGRSLGGAGGTRTSCPSLPQDGVQQASPSQGDCLSAGNSSFNMRYGVPVKLMAQRKHILDGQHFRELEEAHKNDLQIAKFLADVGGMKEESQKPATENKRVTLRPTSTTIAAVMAVN